MSGFSGFSGVVWSLGALIALAIGAGCSNNDDDGNPAGTGGTGGGGGTTVPASWAGVWQISGTVTICDTDSALRMLAMRVPFPSV